MRTIIRPQQKEVIKKKKKTIVLPPGRASYCHLDKPWAGSKGDQKPQYQMAFLMPLKNAKLLIECGIAKAIAEALKKKFPNIKITKDEFGLPEARGYDLPFRHAGNYDKVYEKIENGTNPEYEGMFVFQLKSGMRKPDIRRNDADRTAMNEPGEFYSGCYCRPSVTAFAYHNTGKGASIGLANVLFIKDGEPLGIHHDAEEDFDEIESDDSEGQEEEGEEGEEDY